MLTIADIRRIVDDHIGSEPTYARAFDITEENGSASFVGKKKVKQLVIQYKNNVRYVSIVRKLIIKESYTECIPEHTKEHKSQIWFLNAGTTELGIEEVSDEVALKACLEMYICTGKALQIKIKKSEAEYRRRTGADQSPAHKQNDESMVKFEIVPYNSNHGNSILFKPAIDNAGCVALMHVLIRSLEETTTWYKCHMCVLIPDSGVKTIEACESLLSPDSAEILGVAMAYARNHPELRDLAKIKEVEYNAARTAIATGNNITSSVDCIFTVTVGTNRPLLSKEFQILSLNVTYDR